MAQKKFQFIRWARMLGVPVGLLVVITIFAEKYAETTSALWTVGLIPGLILNQIAFLVYAQRLHYLLKIRGIFTSWLDALRIHFQSMFYAVIIPLSIGAEMSRYVKLGGVHKGEKKGERVSVILVDRIWSLVATIIAVLLTAPVVLNLENLQWDMVIFAVIGLIVAISMVWYVVGKKGFGARLKKELQWYLSSHRSITYTTILSLLAHFGACTSIYFVAWALNMDITWAQTIFAVSVGMLFLVVPVSVFGAGATELASGLVYVQQGLQIESAIILAAITYGYRLFGAIQGGVWEAYEAALVPDIPKA